MATNATEKDKALNDIISYCEMKMNALWHDIDIIEATPEISDDVAIQSRGQAEAYEDIAGKCHRLLVRSGSMPVGGDTNAD